jgi:site-specific recombinase XerD
MTDRLLTEGVVQGFVRRATKRAGLENNGPHILRHTFCSHLAMHGAATEASQALARHADLTTTQAAAFISANWQWLFSTIAAPVVAYWYAALPKKRKNKLRRKTN